MTALKEGAQSEADGWTLEVLFDVVSHSDSLSAILENNTLFIEPYVSNPNKPVTVKQTDRFCLYSSTNYYLLSCQTFSIPPSHATCARLLL